MAGSVMTRDEIEAAFPGEWVLIADPVVDEALEVVRGAVVAHERERADLHESIMAARPPGPIAVRFIADPKAEEIGYLL